MTELVKVVKDLDVFENDSRLLIQINRDFQVFVKLNNVIEVDENVFENDGVWWEIKILSDYVQRKPLMFLRHLKTFHKQVKEVLFVNSYYDFDTLERCKR